MRFLQAESWKEDRWQTLKFLVRFFPFNLTIGMTMGLPREFARFETPLDGFVYGIILGLITMYTLVRLIPGTLSKVGFLAALCLFCLGSYGFTTFPKPDHWWSLHPAPSWIALLWTLSAIIGGFILFMLSIVSDMKRGFFDSMVNTETPFKA